jgi:hypothetical protein
MVEATNTVTGPVLREEYLTYFQCTSSSPSIGSDTTYPVCQCLVHRCLRFSFHFTYSFAPTLFFDRGSGGRAALIGSHGLIAICNQQEKFVSLYI